MSSRDRIGFAGLCLYLAVGWLPLAASLVYGGLYSVGLTGMLREGATLDHWRAVILRGESWVSLLFSAYVAATVTVLAVGCAMTLALLLTSHVRRGPLSYALYLPLALPGAVAAFVTLQALGGSGVLARIAHRVGLLEGGATFPPLVHDAAGIGIIAAHLGLIVPFFTLLFAELREHERIPELASVGRALGASGLETLRRITVPVLLRGAGPQIGLAFVVVLGSYEIPLLLGRTSPEMLSVLALRKFNSYDLSQKPEAFVIALLYTLATALFVLALHARRDAHA